MRTRIKICGFTRAEHAVEAIALGADAIGLVFYPPSPRNVSIEQADILCRALPPFVSIVGLFVDAAESTVHEVLERVPLSVLQFHGNESPEYCQRFACRYIKAVRVKPGLDLLQYAARYPSASGLLLDAWVHGVPGGTGERFDWSLIPDRLPLPIILSGGLTADNVSDAVCTVKPWAVDVSSSVEVEKGLKCADKMKVFIDGVCNADVRLA